MELELRKNDHKGGWQYETPGYLINRLHQEFGELVEVLGPSCPTCHRRREEAGRPEAITAEAADVANFAMMISDTLGVTGQSSA